MFPKHFLWGALVCRTLLSFSFSFSSSNPFLSAPESKMILATKTRLSKLGWKPSVRTMKSQIPSRQRAMLRSEDGFCANVVRGRKLEEESGFFSGDFSQLGKKYLYLDMQSPNNHQYDFQFGTWET
jgi:hypothetical protein